MLTAFFIVNFTILIVFSRWSTGRLIALLIAAWLSHLSVVTDWPCSVHCTDTAKRPSFTPLAVKERPSDILKEGSACSSRGLSLECSGSNLIYPSNFSRRNTHRGRSRWMSVCFPTWKHCRIVPKQLHTSVGLCCSTSCRLRWPSFTGHSYGQQSGRLISHARRSTTVYTFSSISKRSKDRNVTENMVFTARRT